MRLDDYALLDLWAKADRASVASRPAILLDALVAPQEPTAVDLPIGARDRALISARSRHFGSAMSCATACISCNEEIEISFDLSELDSDDASPEAGDLRLEHQGAELVLRKPTTRDLAAAAAADKDDALPTLVRRCLSTADDSDLPDELSSELIQSASSALQSADPDADIELQIICPSCAKHTNAPFDIGLCLWEDISRAARRVMREVHHFASVYGWTEAETLAVPRQRRLQYLTIGSA